NKQFKAHPTCGVLVQHHVIDRWVKTLEGGEFMVAIGASNIPTLCIDGEITFISNIPPVSEIKKVIEARLSHK
ncbi:MAG: hypothetical protein ACOYN4_19620, partial [Bacteroidales bacterium]